MRLKNFLIHKDVELRPGLHLNLIIGPNGSGKSTIVSGTFLKNNSLWLFFFLKTFFWGLTHPHDAFAYCIFPCPSAAMCLGLGGSPKVLDRQKQVIRAYQSSRFKRSHQ